MSDSGKSPFLTFIKIVFCGGLIFAAFIIGDNLGYKRGYQETAEFTLNKLGIEKTINNVGDYDAILDEYIVENNSLDKTIENLLSTKNMGEKVGNFVTDFVTDFINDLLGD
ncbi:hypothetical protein AGMMS50255_7930 [Spirochaetia bacterium]|nr:hypothetical protein AGMMS50255_7930 [Spirochaetia bacterium]